VTLLLAYTLQDPLDVEARLTPALLDHALHHLDRVLREQLQDADVLLGTTAGTMLLLQRFPQRVEDGRQLPAAKDVGMVQCRRPALQALQIMFGDQDLFVPAIGTRVGRDHLASPHDIDALHVHLEGHLLERGETRHAVAVGIETHLLILIDLGQLEQTRIKRRGRK
jgi:hypothetical protein